MPQRSGAAAGGRYRSSVGNALAMLTQQASAIMPLAQAVQDDDLVPKSAFGFDGRDVAHGHIQIGQVIRHVRGDRSRLLRIECRLGNRAFACLRKMLNMAEV